MKIELSHHLALICASWLSPSSRRCTADSALWCPQHCRNLYWLIQNAFRTPQKSPRSLLEKLAPKTPSGARKASLALAGFEKHRLNVYYVGKAGESTQLPEWCMCERWACDMAQRMWGFSSTEMDGPVARLQMSLKEIKVRNQGVFKH
jgi:hypothetical protein